MLSHELIEIKLYGFYNFRRGSEIYPKNNIAVMSKSVDIIVIDLI